MTKILCVTLALVWAIGLTACSQNYAENCFAKAATGSGQDAKGTGGEGAGEGVGGGKSDASAESGCSKTPVD